MKEKLVQLLKGLGLCLLVVGVMAAMVFISVRLFTVVRTLSSNEPMNHRLLPETYDLAIYQKNYPEISKGNTEYLEREIDRLRREIDSAKKVTQKSQPKEQLDEISNEVDAVSQLLQQLQNRKPLRYEEIQELPIKWQFLFGELSEIQARIEKLKKETPAPAPSAP